MNNYEISQILKDRQIKNKKERLRRIDKLEKTSSQYANLVTQRNALLAQAALFRISNQLDKALENEKKAELLDKKEKEILRSYNLPENYLDRIYDCPICHDQGFLPNGQMCQCLHSLIRNNNYRKYDMTDMTKNYTFDNYDLGIFSDQVNPRVSNSPRRVAKYYLDFGREYCRKFGKDSKSLFVYGDVGTGKTYFVSCIANELIKKDVDIIYLTAPNLMNYLYDDLKNRTEMKKSHKEAFKTTDLLIIDDLGTETSNDYSISSLTEILDYRILNNTNTLITSNYQPREIMKNEIYPQRLVSRLLGNFEVLPFFGSDLRTGNKKRN